MDKSLTMFLGGALVLAICVLVLLLIQPLPAVGSVSVTDEYNATTTAANALYGSLVQDTLIRTGQGAFGSIVITGANTGILNFYDGTTTAAGHTKTLIASIPASAAAGTYTFDAEYKIGLYMDLVAGSAPTSTVTWR